MSRERFKELQPYLRRLRHLYSLDPMIVEVIEADTSVVPFTPRKKAPSPSLQVEYATVNPTSTDLA